MTLVNGRGQLGSALSRLTVPIDVFVYHTWNITDKSEAAQRACYEAFVKFRSDNSGRVVFISTKSRKNDAYVAYKQMAETHADDVVRLPSLIGNGTCALFRDPTSEAYGTMEVMRIEDAATAIAEYLTSGAKGMFNVPGVEIPAYMVRALIRFGVGP